MRPRLGLLQFGLLAAVAAGLAACESWLREGPRRLDREPLAPTTALPPQPTAPIPLAQPEPPEIAPLVERGTGQFVRPLPDRSRASILRNAAGDQAGLRTPAIPRAAQSRQMVEVDSPLRTRSAASTINAASWGTTAV